MSTNIKYDEKDVLLDIKNVSVTFSTENGPLKAVRDVSFTVPKNRIVGLVGESGCGKSTLASVLIRLTSENANIEADGVYFKGEDILSLPPNEMQDLRGKDINMIFQDPMTSLNPVLSIATQMIDIQYRENISKAEKKDRVVKMLEKVGIADPEQRIKQYPHEFSGGMRQRICIAMALLSKPSLIIADEPTTALDVTLEAQIVHLLKELQAEVGCSIVCVSHHLGMISELCHDVVVMYAGEILEQGSARDIFHNPAHPYTQRLLECDPANIHEKVEELPTIQGEIPNLIDLPMGCIFKDRCHEKMDICETESPQVTVLSASHKSSCHLLNSGAQKCQN